ncbi:MAG: hypothetical protein JW850_06495, partial [Thermoflexales bacterium]|nr:hypothetical protein [Thermoflexales bacterium]
RRLFIGKHCFARSTQAKITLFPTINRRTRLYLPDCVLCTIMLIVQLVLLMIQQARLSFTS